MSSIRCYLSTATDQPARDVLKSALGLVNLAFGGTASYSLVVLVCCVVLLRGCAAVTLANRGQPVCTHNIVRFDDNPSPPLLMRRGFSAASETADCCGHKTVQPPTVVRLSWRVGERAPFVLIVDVSVDESISPLGTSPPSDKGQLHSSSSLSPATARFPERASARCTTPSSRLLLNVAPRLALCIRSRPRAFLYQQHRLMKMQLGGIVPHEGLACLRPTVTRQWPRPADYEPKSPRALSRGPLARLGPSLVSQPLDGPTVPRSHTSTRGTQIYGPGQTVRAER